MADDCLDERILRDLCGLRRPGGLDIYMDALPRYLASSKQSIEAMSQHIVAQNVVELSLTAHPLKLNSGMLSARTLA